MSLLDPAERTRTGIRNQTELRGAPASEPATLYEASWRDYVYAEVWNRPGLDLRSRFWVAMAGAASTRAPEAIIDGYVRGALTHQEISLAELREGALHASVYIGWSQGAHWDASITRVAEELGLDPAPFAPIRAEAWDPAARHAEGAANFHKVMVFGGPPPKTAYFEGGILNFVFGEMWNRPALDERSRRWITLVGVADSSAATPIRSHAWSAMASGHCNAEEMFEFVLQYAIRAGWPRASYLQGVVIEMSERVAKGQTFEV